MPVLTERDRIQTTEQTFNFACTGTDEQLRVTGKINNIRW